MTPCQPHFDLCSLYYLQFVNLTNNLCEEIFQNYPLLLSHLSLGLYFLMLVFNLVLISCLPLSPPTCPPPVPIHRFAVKIFGISKSRFLQQPPVSPSSEPPPNRWNYAGKEHPPPSTTYSNASGWIHRRRRLRRPFCQRLRQRRSPPPVAPSSFSPNRFCPTNSKRAPQSPLRTIPPPTN